MKEVQLSQLLVLRCTFLKPHVSLQQIKTDMVLVMCKKQTSKKWECLTKVEKQTKEKKE